MIEFRIKEKTKSLNESFRGDWRPRTAAAKRQRTKAIQACPRWPGGPLLVVRLTRVSPGTLDGDAVPAALKHVRDGVAARLRLDDASPLVDWQYHQAKGEAEVVVQIWKAEEEAPPKPEGRTVAKPVKPKASANDVARYEREAKRGKRLMPGTGESGGSKRAPSPSYTPPHSRPVDAVKQAEETFAPAACSDCSTGVAISDGRCQRCLDAIAEYSKRFGII